VLIAIELVLALTFMTYLGRAFKLKPKLVSLLAVGRLFAGLRHHRRAGCDRRGRGRLFLRHCRNSVAGRPLSLSLSSRGPLPAPERSCLRLVGRLAVDNTAEATAAGALYSDAAGKVAVLAKTCRNATIGFIVLGYAIYWAGKGQAAEVQNKAAFLWRKFPKFVLGFC